MRKAYQSWTDQISRCYRPKTEAFKYYGALGIKVCYSSREFVSWYLHALKKFKGRVPSVDRVDSSLHYCFCNIRLKEHYNNAVEGLLRGDHSKRWRPIHIVDFSSKKILKTVANASIASRETGVWRNNVVLHCVQKGNRGQKTGVTFRYADVLDGSLW